MKVKCLKILSPATGKDLGEKSTWLTAGKEYVVLALTLEFDEIVKVLIESDEGSLKDFYFNQFEITDSSYPENWITKCGENSIVWKAPESWLVDGFWDRLDDGEEEAIAEYMEERKNMI